MPASTRPVLKAEQAAGSYTNLTMDVMGRAAAVLPTDGLAAVQEWRDVLAASTGGPTALAHLDGDLVLETTPEGRSAVERFIRALAGRPTGAGLDWYVAALRDPVLGLTCQGPGADAFLPDALCKLGTATMVADHLAATPPTLPPRSSRRPADWNRLRRWVDNVVCGPRWRDTLDPAKIVSGYVPAVFSTFSEDRDGRCPVGTSASRVREVLGLPPIDPAEPHVLLHYSRARVGPALVPTAFDAAMHEFFVPATAGAECGFTKDLGPGDGVGVREVVVRPFPTASITTRPESVP